MPSNNKGGAYKLLDMYKRRERVAYHNKSSGAHFDWYFSACNNVTAVSIVYFGSFAISLFSRYVAVS